MILLNSVWQNLEDEKVTRLHKVDLDQDHRKCTNLTRLISMSDL